MSANLDLVRSIYAAWERGDFTWAEWAHPEFEYEDADGPLGGGTGDFDQTLQGVREFLSGWEDFRLEADGFRELDDERVLALERRSGRSKTSGLDLGQMRTSGARLFYIHEGKVSRTVVYFDRDLALADLGLSPDDAT